MCSIAEKSLADVPLTETDKPGFRRYIRREALGVVLIISAWNVRPFSLAFLPGTVTKSSRTVPLSAPLVSIPMK